MSKVKVDLLKQINESVAKKKQLAKEVSREKTIAYWVAEFFVEYEKIRKIKTNGDNTFTALALNRLNIQLRNLDRRCDVFFREPEGESPIIEIHWSTQYSTANNCENVMSFDASSAFFQNVVEHI